MTETHPEVPPVIVPLLKLILRQLIISNQKFHLKSKIILICSIIMTPDNSSASNNIWHQNDETQLTTREPSQFSSNYRYAPRNRNQNEPNSGIVRNQWSLNNITN